MSEPTERQIAAWPASVAEAQRYVTTSTVPTELDNYNWVRTWAEEVRPGRGQDLSAIYMDGEYVVQITLDVYGYGGVSVGETAWVHNSYDEECDCEYCEKERRDDY